MPINYRDYNPDWKQTSRRIRFERAGGKCERCGVENYAVGYWIDGVFRTAGYLLEHLEVTGEDLCQRAGIPGAKRPVKVVLTVAHLDHSERNDEESNLLALCQRCHLVHDGPNNRWRRKIGKNAHKIMIHLFPAPAPAPGKLIK